MSKKKKSPTVSGLFASAVKTAPSNNLASTQAKRKTPSNAEKPGSRSNSSTLMRTPRVTWNYENVVAFIASQISPSQAVQVDASVKWGYRISVCNAGVDPDQHPSSSGFYVYNSQWHPSLEDAAKHFMASW